MSERLDWWGQSALRHPEMRTAFGSRKESDCSSYRAAAAAGDLLQKALSLSLYTLANMQKYCRKLQLITSRTHGRFVLAPAFKSLVRWFHATPRVPICSWFLRPSNVFVSGPIIKLPQTLSLFGAESPFLRKFLAAAGWWFFRWVFIQTLISPAAVYARGDANSRWEHWVLSPSTVSQQLFN